MSEPRLEHPHTNKEMINGLYFKFYLILLAFLCFNLSLFHTLFFQFSFQNGFSSHLLLKSYPFKKKSYPFIFIGVHHLLCSSSCTTTYPFQVCVICLYPPPTIVFVTFTDFLIMSLLVLKTHILAHSVL